MRRTLAILLVLVAVAAAGITPDDFETVVDFEASIESIASLVRRGLYDQIDVERYVVLQGTVASVQVFDADADTFQALVELVSSEWEDLRSIRVDRIYVLVEGPDYAARFQSPPTAGTPGQSGRVALVTPNSDLMVVGPFIGTALSETDEELAVIYAVKLR
ncbi:MAG: hypothetical protein EA382_19300 [Spirochaetaceae bacterium]|nr:MAG: hypothetical protein EA382_19300 [Spirochaetaceae bacterium]